MRASIQYQGKDYVIDLNHPLDISITLHGNNEDPEAWYLDSATIEPVRSGDWTGAVRQGASVNFNTITFNPHGHTTHTECVGHITKEFHSLNRHLLKFFFFAKVISLTPQQKNEDQVITRSAIEKVFREGEGEALVIRTMPNTAEKRSRKYSHTNWPYLEESAAAYIKECGVQHLLIDLPSVDKEKDEGRLEAHKAFWDYPDKPRYKATITELIFVPEIVKDGEYFLSLQPVSFENDAAPCKPVLYKVIGA